MAAFTHSSTEEWFNCSIHPSFSFRGVFNQEQRHNTWSHRRHPVHCLPPCSLRCPVEVHGVASTKKAQKGEGSCEAEECCVKMVGDILHLLTVRTKFRSRLCSGSETICCLR